jgi:hypothetical protein
MIDYQKIHYYYVNMMELYSHFVRETRNIPFDHPLTEICDDLYAEYSHIKDTETDFMEAIKAAALTDYENNQQEA